MFVNPPDVTAVLRMRPFTKHRHTQTAGMAFAFIRYLVRTLHVACDLQVYPASPLQYLTVEVYMDMYIPPAIYCTPAPTVCLHYMSHG